MKKYSESKYQFTPKSSYFSKNKSPIMIEESSFKITSMDQDNRRFSCLGASSFEQPQQPSKFVAASHYPRKEKPSLTLNTQTSNSAMVYKIPVYQRTIGASQERYGLSSTQKSINTTHTSAFPRRVEQATRNNDYSQKRINKKNTFEDYLQQARKQKNKSIPQFKSTLELTSKPKYQIQRPLTKNSHFVDLRDTEDTVGSGGSPKQFHPHKLSIRDFIKIKKLGKGKNGEVFSAIHKNTGFVCALKVISKRDIYRKSESESATIQNQLLREIKIQMFFNHSNLIQLYSVFADRDNIYLLQQLGTDGQLYDLMKKKTKFSEQSTALISRQVAKGLEGLHKKNVIHRDVKPQNVVLIYGIAKLCDFGWSIYCPKQLRSTLCGTPLYLSPEVLTGNDYDYKIDIWAFGTLVYETYTGQNPFQILKKDDLQRIVNDDIVFAENMPSLMRNFFSRVLKKQSKKRPSATEILKLQFLVKYKQLETSQQLSTL